MVRNAVSIPRVFGSYLFGTHEILESERFRQLWNIPWFVISLQLFVRRELAWDVIRCVGISTDIVYNLYAIYGCVERFSPFLGFLFNSYNFTFMVFRKGEIAQFYCYRLLD